uniref:Uncharacterized protein n=1 Tax=Plectus sambesii TaxID=2011161 RepID=A0A914XGJ0_9BILA
MAAVKQKSVSEDPCAVCGDVADGIHYNVMSCRGCNAFFRRAVTCNANYTCRKDGNCALSKGARCTCRACRLNKCFQVGMVAEAVQPKRDTNKNYNWVARKRKCVTEDSSPSVSPMDSKTFLDIRSPTVLSLSSTEGGGLIERLIVQERLEERRACTMMCRSVEEFVRCDADEFELRPHTIEDFSFMQRMLTSRLIDWCDAVPEFRLMSSTNKMKLLKAYAMKYTVLECTYGAARRRLTDRIVIGTRYIEIGKIGLEDKSDDLATAQLKIRLFGEAVGQVLHEIVVPMVNMNITTAERAALRLIAFWNPGNIGLDAETAAQIAASSNRIITELHSWYEKNNVPNSPERFGNFMLLLPAIVKYAHVCAEHMVIMTTFDMVGAGGGDPMFQELLRS